MIVTCENCGTKFSFDESRLGIGGRKLRCASCKHVWHVSPPGLEEEKPEAAAPAAETKIQPKIRSDKDESPKKVEAPVEDKPRKVASVNTLKVAACVLVVLNFMSFI